MLIFIFSLVWAVILFAAGVIAYASRTGPDEAIKNISQWLERAGLANTQSWLSEQWRRKRLRVVGAVALLVLFVVGVFTAGMIAEKELSSGTPGVVARPANHWPPLSDKEALSLRDELRKLPPEKLDVLCGIPACADLAESIYDVSQGMKWPGTYSSSYFMDTGIHQGIEIWSFPKKEKDRDRIAAIIEHVTNGRLKISTHMWPNNPPPESENDINLVVGRFK